MKSDVDLYALLGVDPHATPDEIRSAFRAAARGTHPDRFVSYVQRVRATARMQELNYAYSILRDPERRRAYDASRLPASPTGPSAGATAVEGVTAARTRQSIRTEWLLGIGWLLASGVVAYFYAPTVQAQSLIDYVEVMLVSLVATPFLVLIAALAVAIPSFIVAKFFERSYAERRVAQPTSTARLLWDVGVRVFGLAVALLLFTRAVRSGVESVIPYMILLAVIGSFAGELVAVLMYVARLRRVLAQTNTLLRIGTPDRRR